MPTIGLLNSLGRDQRVAADGCAAIGRVLSDRVGHKSFIVISSLLITTAYFVFALAAHSTSCHLSSLAFCSLACLLSHVPRFLHLQQIQCVLNARQRVQSHHSRDDGPWHHCNRRSGGWLADQVGLFCGVSFNRVAGDRRVGACLAIAAQFAACAGRRKMASAFTCGCCFANASKGTATGFGWLLRAMLSFGE